MSGAVPGYVHISQRGRAAKRQVPQQNRTQGSAATLRPMTFSSGDQQGAQKAGAQENEARGFVLYVGLNEELAAANGTSLVRIVQDLRTYAHHLAPEAESYAAVALAPVHAEGSDLEVVRNALGDPTAVFYQAELHKQAREAEQPATPSSNGVLIDLARREVFLDGEQLMLTFKEFELLAHLVENSTRTVGRDELWSRSGAPGTSIPTNAPLMCIFGVCVRSWGVFREPCVPCAVRGTGSLSIPKLWCGLPPNTPSSLFTLETPRSFLRARGFRMPILWRAIMRQPGVSGRLRCTMKVWLRTHSETLNA